MRVIMLMLTAEPGVTRRARLTLPWCAQGGPYFPLDAWSVVMTSVFWMVQNHRSTDPTFGSIFGVSIGSMLLTKVRASFHPVMTLGGSADPPTLEVFYVLDFNNTKRCHVHMFYWWQHTSRI